MKSLDNLKKHLVLVLAAGLLISSMTVNNQLSKPNIVITKQDQSWNLDNKMILNFNLGLKRLASSFLWISTILESDEVHYKNKDLNSWMFLRFKTISELEPKFYENYSYGGVYLSIVKDDLIGASYIYDKGLFFYPNDFSLLRDAGFHYYFEVENYKRAFEIYSKLKNHSSISPLMISTLAKLEKYQGNSEAAYELLLNNYLKLQDKTSTLAQKIESQLYSLKTESDLNCLNSKDSKLKECSKADRDGNLYIYKEGLFLAVRDWQPFKAKRKNHGPN